jgi:hypothetical protein
VLDLPFTVVFLTCSQQGEKAPSYRFSTVMMFDAVFVILINRAADIAAADIAAADIAAAVSGCGGYTSLAAG